MVSDFQDLHKASLHPRHRGASLSFLIVANARLCGLPFLSGFYSKDLCIEGAVFSQQAIRVRIVFYLATLLTVSYTVRIVQIRFMG